MAPEGSTSMQAELSFSKHRPLKASESSLSEQAWEELSRLGFAAGSKAPLFSQTRKVDYAYAIMNHEREKSVQHIREFLESKSFIPCGRFGDWDYIWTDKVLLSGKSAAQKAVRLGS